LDKLEITKLADALEPINYENGDTIVIQEDLGEYFLLLNKAQLVSVRLTIWALNNNCQVLMLALNLEVN